MDQHGRFKRRLDVKDADKDDGFLSYFSCYYQVLIGLIEFSMNKEFFMPTLSVFFLRSVKQLKNIVIIFLSNVYHSF
jgi:hypothetical protein